jgi:hypothetical protein
MTEKKESLPRGLRNNNPLNIRLTNTTWQGQLKPGTDKEFCQFVEMRYGYRAAFVLLHRYYHVWNCKTVRQIINRWAPSSENDTAAYVNRVCKLMMFPPDDKLPSVKTNPGVWIELVCAMEHVECGSNSNALELAKGLELAFPRL